MNHLLLQNLTLARRATIVRNLIALSLSLILLPTSPAYAQQPADTAAAFVAHNPKPLERAKPVERTIAEGTKHVYNIAVEADQFLHIRLIQNGADVVLTLIAPDKKRIVEIDSPNGTEGPEHLVHIAETSGNYQLEISASTSPEDSGRYELKLEEQRKGEPRDASRIQSQTSLLEAVKLGLQKTPEARQQAIAKYDDAIKYAREADNKGDIAKSLTAAGRACNRIGDRKKAIEYYNEALEIHLAAGDRASEADTRVLIGESLFYLREHKKSIDHYIIVEAIYNSLGNRKALSDAYYNMTVLYFALRDFPKALEYANLALPVARQIGNRSVESATLATIGAIYQQLSDSEKALEFYNQALPLYREKDKLNHTITLNNIASIHNALGNYEKSVEIYKEVLPVFRSINQKGNEALALNGIGQYHLTKGQYKEALEYYNQALQIGRTTGQSLTKIVALNQIGKVYTLMRDYQKASESLGEAYDLTIATNAKSAELAVLQSLTNLARESGNLTEALSKVDAVIKLLEDMRPSVHVQDLRYSQSESLHAAYAFKIDILMQQHKLSPQTGLDQEAFQFAERARARSLLEILKESRADIRQGVAPELLEQERSLQKSLNTRSEGLLRLIANKAEEQKVQAARNEIENVRTEFQQVQAQIRAKSPRYAALTQPQPMNLAEIQKLVLDPETTLLEYSLGNTRSYLWVVTQRSIKTIELPAAKKIEEATKRIYDILTARNKVVRFETTDEKAERVEVADNDFEDATEALSELILDPAAAHLKTRKLLVVADGILQYIPFSILRISQKTAQLSASSNQATDTVQKKHSRYRPLIEDHEIVSIPSASTLGIMRCEIAGRKPAPKSIAIFADPVFESDDSRVKEGLAKAETGLLGNLAPRKKRSAVSEVSRSAKDTGFPEDGIEISRLPFTRREARTIASLVPANEVKVALDFEANRAVATNSELSNYRYIHFATHSLINSRQPELSGIILSMVDERGNEQDGFLRAHEIYNLNLPAELVVLSGCQSGLGKQIKGEGIISITRGFMYAGAARVMVSLWDVDDEATSELMSRFYKALLSRKVVSPATALREAQLSMSKEKRWHSPYYWAAFVLQGEPN